MKAHQVFMTKETNALELEFSKKKKETFVLRSHY